jgi:hypothetical protein
VSRPIFGVTDSPRAAALKRKAAKREEARLDRTREFIPVVERDANDEPVRFVMVRNPHFRRPPVPRMVCPDGGGRCYESCELIDDCPGPVPNPARALPGDEEGR